MTTVERFRRRVYDTEVLALSPLAVEALEAGLVVLLRLGLRLGGLRARGLAVAQTLQALLLPLRRDKALPLLLLGALAGFDLRTAGGDGLLERLEAALSLLDGRQVERGTGLEQRPQRCRLRVAGGDGGGQLALGRGATRLRLR